MWCRALAAVPVFFLTTSALSLKCYNGTGLTECRQYSCWSNSGPVSQYGCGPCPDIGTQGTVSCTVCTTDKCNMPESVDVVVAELSTTWRWLVLLLFFFLALVLGIVVLVHFRRNGCKWGSSNDTTNVTELGADRHKNRRSSLDNDDRDINQWKDLEVDVS